mgnify:CR=1 FL=1
MIRSLVRRLGCVAVLALSCCLGNPAVAADAPPEKPVKAAAPSLAIPEATTGHVLRLGDQRLTLATDGIGPFTVADNRDAVP